MVADLLGTQEVDDIVQGEPVGNSEIGLTADHNGSHLSLPTDSGVVDGLVTDGVSSYDALTKMSLGFVEWGTGSLCSRLYMSPPRRPGLNNNCLSAPSPVTPLELPLSLI